MLVLTFGTGIGSALLIDGVLVPNTELGHLELDGHDAETRAAASTKDREDLSYKQWAKRVDAYLLHLEKIFTPDLFVVGGGVSKNADRWVPHLHVTAPVCPRSCSTTPASWARRWPRSNVAGSDRELSRRPAQYTAAGRHARTGLDH